MQCSADVRRDQRGGFTLVELLVVIGIVGLLTAILFPVFARARERAKQAWCASNMRQIGIAIHMYTDDWDDCFPVPPFGYPQYCCWGGWHWVASIRPYVRTDEIFFCPSELFWRRIPGGDGRMCETSYCYASCFFKDTARVNLGLESDVVSHSWAEVLYPARKVISWEGWPNHNPAVMGGEPKNWKKWLRRWEGNVLFVDGHVKYVSRANELPSALSDGRPDPNWTRDGVSGKDYP